MQLGPIRRCLSRWRAQGHLRAWATWASTTEERHATLATLARALGHFRNRELSRGWATWAAAAVERQAAFALLAPAVGVQFCLARAFRSSRMGVLVACRCRFEVRVAVENEDRQAIGRDGARK